MKNYKNYNEFKQIFYKLVYLTLESNNNIYNNIYKNNIKKEKIINNLSKQINRKEIEKILKKLNEIKSDLEKIFFENKMVGGYDEKKLKEWQPTFLTNIYGWEPDTTTVTKSLDIVDTIIDFAGFIPGLGIPIDITGFLFSLARQRYVDAMFSLINVIPVIGSFIGTPGKYITKFLRVKKKIDKIKEMKERLEYLNENDERKYLKYKIKYFTLQSEEIIKKLN